MWERISCVYFRSRGSLSANFCPTFITFLQSEIQSAIDRLLPSPTLHQRKAPGTNESVKVFLLIPGHVLPTGLGLGTRLVGCLGAYKRDVVVIIKMGAYIYGVLILCGCLLSRFYSMRYTCMLYM